MTLLPVADVSEIRAAYEHRRFEMLETLRGRFPAVLDDGNATDSMAWAILRMEDGHPIFAIAFHVEGKTFSGTWDSRRPLLSANSKLRKLPGRAAKFRAIGLAMAPANYSGKELCAWRTDGCTAACNGFWSGMNVTISTRLALIGRALLWNYFRELFAAKLRHELQNFAKLCKRLGIVPACRLNISTDVVYERLLPDIFAEFPEIRFLDYTKALPKHRCAIPSNYSLSHSFSERTTAADVEAIVSAGRNVVIAFDSAYRPQKKLWGALPAAVRFTDSAGRDFTLPVVNGDRHDLRLPEMDGRGVVIGLHGKSGGRRVDRAVASGFMLHHPEGAKLRTVSRFIGTVTVCR